MAYYSHKMFAEESLCEPLKMNTFPNIKGEPNANTDCEGSTRQRVLRSHQQINHMPDLEATSTSQIQPCSELCPRTRTCHWKTVFSQPQRDRHCDCCLNRRRNGKRGETAYDEVRAWQLILLQVPHMRKKHFSNIYWQ